MKLRHYLLIAFTVIAIAFFQPLILLLGGVTLIVGVTALIYSDLTPEAQDACENKIIQLLDQARSFLRRTPRGTAPQRPVNVHRTASYQLLAEQSRADEIKVDLNPEASAQVKNEAQDKASDLQDGRTGKQHTDNFYSAANPDL